MDGLLEGTQGMVLAVALAGLAAALLFGFQRLKVAEHKWAADTAGKLSAMGLSTSVTAPLSNLATGDIPGAIGAGVHTAEYLKNPANVGIEVVNIVQKALADPVQKPLVLKLVADIAGGATPEQIRADLKAEFDASPAAQLGLGPMASGLYNSIEKIKAVASKPELQALISHLPDAHGYLAGLLDAGHTVGAASVPAPAVSGGTAADPALGTKTASSP